MKPYNNYRYIFPPRPEIKIPSSALQTYERMNFLAQPKLNGSCAPLFTDGVTLKFMNRHNSAFARQLIESIHLTRLHRGSGYTVLVGEYMNKAKKDGSGKLFNGVYVVFDILVSNGKYLTGTSLEERLSMLQDLYPVKKYDDFIDQISEKVFIVKSFKKDFNQVYGSLVKIDMYEGLVLKRNTGILDTGYREKNNTGWQLKCRKATKNYTF